MDIELKGKYYKSYLEKINENLNKRKWSPHSLHHKNLNKFIQKHIMNLNDGAIVLDAGCGLSAWLTQEIEKKISYIGIDCQEEAIQYCKTVFPNREYEIGDLYNIQYEDNFCDAVVMREVIEHFKIPEKAIDEVWRVLKQSGLFILTTPNYENPLCYIIEHVYSRFFGGQCKPYLPDVHPSRFRRKTLFDILKDNFKGIEINTISLKITLAAAASNPFKDCKADRQW